MDDNYSVNMLKKAAFVDEMRDYIDIVIEQAKRDNNDQVLIEMKPIKDYFARRIEHLTKLSK